MNDVNVAGGWTDTPSERTIFCDEPIHHRIKAGERMPDLLVQHGFFKSKKEAKKNGWDKPIPGGYTEYVIGKLRRQVTIWNPTTGLCI